MILMDNNAPSISAVFANNLFLNFKLGTEALSMAL